MQNSAKKNVRLRIGYAGSLESGGTCAARLAALQSVEPEVWPFDVDQELHDRRPVLARWAEHLPGGGGGSRRLNRALLRFARERRLNLVWIDKGQWVSGATLRGLRRHGVRLVHHVTDALWPRNLRLQLTRLRLAATAKLYDHFITSNASDCQRLQRVMPGRVRLTQLGYDERRFDAAPISDPALIARWRRDVIFVGHHEPRTERGLLALIEAGLPVQVFGRRWLERARANPKLAGHVNDSLGDQEYVWALKLARIGLGFVSEWNYNQTAGRSYEIPACGTMLLALRTAEHQRHYREGDEAEFFGDETELVAKVRRYLADAHACRFVAACGRERCVASGYSWRDIMQRDWAAIGEQSRESPAR
ncbi:MAG: glycosyltransferase [Opitutaceae bacterium]